jgi:hypothetical protein
MSQHVYNIRASNILSCDGITSVSYVAVRGRFRNMVCWRTTGDEDDNEKQDMKQQLNRTRLWCAQRECPVLGRSAAKVQQQMGRSASLLCSMWYILPCTRLWYITSSMADVRKLAMHTCMYSAMGVLHGVRSICSIRYDR